MVPSSLLFPFYLCVFVSSRERAVADVSAYLIRLGKTVDRDALFHDGLEQGAAFRDDTSAEATDAKCQ